MKFFYGLLLFWLLIPNTAQAILIAPSADVVISIQTTGGDGVFSFNFSGSGLFSFFENFTVQTENGLGSHSIHVPFLISPDYTIIEAVPEGWVLDGTTCDNSFSPIENGVRLSLGSFSTINCAFNNSKIPVKHPVLIIPGITGTEMYEGNEKLWLNLNKMLGDVGDDFLDALKFNDAQESEHNIVSGEVIRKIDPLGIVSVFDYTDGLVKEFEGHGYTEGVDLFTFPYDWRLGVSSENLNKLQNTIDQILLESGADKVDVVAHSAGGLLLKKYISNSSEPHIGKAIFLGVPVLGAPKAIKVLLSGDNFGIPVLSSAEIKNIARNMPAMYQLSPSEEYQNIAGPYFSIHTQNLLSSSDHDFNFQETQNYLVTQDLNSLGFENAGNLHTAEFDSFDPGSKGVETYNILGCKQATIGKIIERKTDNPALKPVVNGYAIKFVSGDGTVPLQSAESLKTAPGRTFYALKADHGKMPSQGGIRQKIVNIMTGLEDSATDITTDRSSCKLNGKLVSVFSPLDISAMDILGNVTEVNLKGEVIENISGSNLEILGDHKFLFLLDNENLNVNLQGTGEGTATVQVENIVNDEVVSTKVFENITVTPETKGKIILDQEPVLEIEGPQPSVGGVGGPPPPVVQPQVLAETTVVPLPAPKIRDGTLALDTTDGRTIYLIGGGGIKRGFVSPAALAYFGYSFSQVVQMDLSSCPSGMPIEENSMRPDGSLILEGKTVWWINFGKRFGIPSEVVFYAHSFSFAQVVLSRQADFLLLEGEILKEN